MLQDHSVISRDSWEKKCLIGFICEQSKRLSRDITKIIRVPVCCVQFIIAETINENEKSSWLIH